MKTLQTLFLLLSFLPTFSQTMNEKRAMKETHIDFSKEYLYFTLHGMIEIDGHEFLNDTCKCPIIYKANLDAVSIVDTCKNVEYKHRICGVKGCKIIHLEIPVIDIQPYKQPFMPYITPNYYILDSNPL